MFRDTVSKFKKKKDCEKVGKYSQMTKLLPEKVQFPLVMLKEACDLPELV